MDKETELPQFFVPTVRQTDPFGNGRAVLQSLAQAYNLPVTPEQLATAHPNELAPPPPDLLVEVATTIGLTATETLLPLEHLLRGDNIPLPAIVLTKSIQYAPEDYVIIWNKIGPLYQVMDPRLGQRWVNFKTLAAEIGHHQTTLTLAEWQALIETPDFRQTLTARLATLGFDEENIQLPPHLTPQEAIWPITVLDAATRMVTNMVASGRVKRGEEAHQVTQTIVNQTIRNQKNALETIPARYWTVTLPPDYIAQAKATHQKPIPDKPNPAETVASLSNQAIPFQGIRFIHIQGKQSSIALANQPDTTSPPAESPASEAETPTAQPKSILDYLRLDGWFTLSLLALSLAFSAIGLFYQIILFQGLMDLASFLSPTGHNTQVIVIILVFALTMLLLRWFSYIITYKLGDKLEGRMRISVLALIPQLSSLHFQQFSAAEMIERIHNARAVRQIPFYGSEIILGLGSFVLTIIGLAWLDWVSAILALLKLGLTILLMSSSTLLDGENQRVRLYLDKLTRFYLDTMLGLTAIRTHSAERAAQREHDKWFTYWAKNAFNTLQKQTWIEYTASTLSYIVIISIILFYAWRGKNPHNFLLLSFWCLNLDVMGNKLIFLALLFFRDQAKGMRFIQLLSASPEATLLPPEPPEILAIETPNEEPNEKPKGVEITFQDASVKVRDQVILQDVNLTISQGSHLAIVGPSGAGKSTLVGLLLGRYYISSGSLTVDGKTLSYNHLQSLRRETAWIDPAIQLWNRSFLYNLRYGNGEGHLNVIEQADLQRLLERLPQGMQTRLGGEGQLVSGGEGQRVRFGRAMQRYNARLVILDEPFRGLDRPKRQSLLERARAFWPEATLICVTHDVSQTRFFKRILVVDNGKIVEDGDPTTLAAIETGRYHQLLKAEEMVREKFWESDRWRHFWLEEGTLTER